MNLIKLGNIIKWGLIIFIVFSIGFLVWYNYSDSNLISQPQNSSAINLTEKFAGKVPHCSDGIDNDGDGFIDYPEDNDCSDKTDRTERDWSFIYWLLGGFLFASLWLLIIFKDDIFKSKDENDLISKPIGSDRGWELARSWFIKEYLHDIKWKPKYNEPDVYIPYDRDVIVPIKRFPHISDQEHIRFIFFTVSCGQYAGHHIMAYSLSRGEQYIKDGNIRVELHTTYLMFQTLKNTFKMTSSTDRWERVMADLIENASSEEEYKQLIQSSLNLPQSNSNNQGSPLDDLDDEERSQYLSERAKIEANKRKPSSKSKKSSQSQTQQPPTPAFSPSSLDDDS